MSIKLSDDQINALESMVSDFDIEEQSVRQRQIRLWKKLEFYWCGFTKVWWSEVAHDWRIYDSGSGDSGSDYYDKQMNVFRAYLESIIAALSSTVPVIKCAPDDADNVSDCLTARGGTKIASLVYDHIDAPLLWVRALFIYCTQGMIASYNYTDKDERYGTVQVPKFEESEEEIDIKICPLCGTQMDEPTLDQSVMLEFAEQDQFDPGADQVFLDNILGTGANICPQCNEQVNPELSKAKFIVKRLTGVTNEPKARQCIEVNGGLYVKIPNWARNQKDLPYLAYEYETHYSNIYKLYPDIARKFKADTKVTGSGNDMYEKWGRLSPQYYGEYPQNTPTVRNWWFRNSAFECIVDEPIRKSLQKKFPQGGKFTWINDEFAEAIPENLDDHWTITFNPLSEYVHFDPLGLLLTSVQEITDDLVSLTLQTIEHGIPQTFIDPSTVNFDAYRETEAIPGGIYPAKPKGGKNLSDSFYTVQTASLSKEVGPFGDKINELGQFVSGAMPGIFGGAAAGSSRTAAQYSMMTNRSLQRLQITWKMINFWWKNTFAKVIPAYIKDMVDDERIVKAQGKDNFVNILIKKAQLDGKIGSVTLESSEQIPHTWGQIKDTVMELMKMGNPELLAALGASDNMEILQRAIGLENFHIPGESDREKQFEEINILLQSIPMPGLMGEEMPSVMPELMVDNHQIEAEVTREWLVNEAGRQAKADNPDGYKNVLLHLQAHIMMMQQMQMMAPPMPPQENGDGKLKPINKGNGNAA